MKVIDRRLYDPITAQLRQARERRQRGDRRPGRGAAHEAYEAPPPSVGASYERWRRIQEHALLSHSTRLGDGGVGRSLHQAGRRPDLALLH